MRNFKLFAYILLTCILGSACKPGVGDEPTETVNLNIRVALSEMSSQAMGRAIDPPTDAELQEWQNPTPAEKMHTLRIVILHADGTVEYNRFLDFGSNAYLEYGFEQFKVTMNETKKLYLFVNENAQHVDALGVKNNVVDFDFDQYGPGTKFPVDKMATLQINLQEDDTSLPAPLPMSEDYEVEVGTQDLIGTYYVTRAATKFTYILYNNTNVDYQWEGLTLDKMARIEYYLPKNVTYDGNGVITQYEVPTIETNNYYQYIRTFSKELSANGGRCVLEPFYLLEGKWKDEASEGKNYKTSITLSGQELSRYLPELPELPRNTHVVVRIQINSVLEGDVDLTVDVRPYGEVFLEPEFGI